MNLENPQTQDSTKQSLELQGEQSINHKIFLKFNTFKKYVALPLLCFITCFIILAVIKKFTRLKVLLIYDQCKAYQATHLIVYGNNQHSEVVEIFEEAKTKYFRYKKVKFMLIYNEHTIVSYKLQNSTFFHNKKFIETGLSTEQMQKLLHQFGHNQHIVNIPTVWEYLFEELTNLFIIIQYIMCVVLVFQTYYMIVAINMPLLLIALVINYFILKNSLMKIKELAQKDIKVEIIRDSTHQIIDSRQLVPGDIFVPTNELTCDAILIKGQLYVNEASLTGQNIPIAKFHAKNDEIKQYSKLYQGSKILESRLHPLAMVMHTGFITRKGRILRNILFRETPNPIFLKGLGIFMVQLLGISFIMYVVTIKFMIDREISSQLLFFRIFDILNCVLPIFYPTFLNFCYSVSLYRLRKNNIYCSVPSKTIESGKVKIMCFDKTGTLTKNDMKIHSIISLNQDRQMVEMRQQNYKNLQMKLFATCHTVRNIADKLYGDQLDLCMYQYSGYDQINTDDDSIVTIFRKNQIDLQVIKVNQFQSKYQSMSVIVRDKLENRCYVFVKGAPEKLQNLSYNKLFGFNDLVKNLSFKGLRSLAFGYRRIYDVDVQKYLNMERQQLQRDLELLGVVTFENELKQDAVKIIESLQQADIDVKMITGDNIYIAIYTAMRCKMLEKSSSVLIFQGHNQKKDDKYYGQIISLKNGQITSQNISLSKEQYLNYKIPIAMDNGFLSLHPPLFEKVKIFARILPESKAAIVSQFKSIISRKWAEKGIWNRIMGQNRENIGMVGDGTNDILAIKQADIGIGINLSQSGMTSPFSISNLIDIQYMLRQGKSIICILIEIFRMNILCNTGRYFNMMLSAADYTVYSNTQYKILVYALLFGLAIWLLFSKCSDKLSNKIPNDNLMSLEYNLATLLQVIASAICIFILVFILSKNPQFVPGIRRNHIWNFQTQINTVVYLQTQIYFAFYLFFVYRSDPWKCKIWKNYGLFIYFILFVTYSVIHILFIPLDETSRKLLDLVPLPDGMIYYILWITICFIILGYTVEVVLRKLKDKEII